MAQPAGDQRHASNARADDAQSAGLHELNLDFYDELWRRSRLYPPQRFNTWPMIQRLVDHSKTRLEVAPGLRPRLPLAETWSVELSGQAASALAKAGANVVRGCLPQLPLADRYFDLVCALDVIEHVADDEAALASLSRVLADGGTLLCSMPLHPRLWTTIDGVVGHARRYEPSQLVARLAGHGFVIESSAVYGMQPRSRRLAEVGAFFLTRWRWVALRWYTRFFMPIAVRLQKPLDWQPGFDPPDGADEIILVCRKADG